MFKAREAELSTDQVPFPEIYVINLDHRTDRWDKIRQTCEDCGLMAERISAVQASPGWLGCGLSHRKIIEIADEKRLPWVLILEDDASFDQRSIKRFRELLPYLWAHRDKWGRFSGGPTFPPDPELELFDIHHQLFYHSGYATQFDLIQSAAYEVTLGWTQGNGPIDVFYRHLAESKDARFRNICTFPHIATQFTSASDVLGGPNELRDQSSLFLYSTRQLRMCFDTAVIDDAEFVEVKAVHPRWEGSLGLSQGGNLLWHKGTKSFGTYECADSMLIAHWFDYPTDKFVDVSGYFIHQELCNNIPDIQNVFAVRSGRHIMRTTKLSLLIPGTDYEICLRIGTSDLPTLRQVFGRREYESPDLPKSAHVVVDLGANIGLATVFFGLKYPEARVLSVEPENGNFEQLIVNTAALGDRVQKQNAAVWSRDGLINIRTKDDNGVPLGAWGVQVSDHMNQGHEITVCRKFETLMRHAGFSRVDILKVDIEGAELELFSFGVEKWLPKVDLIIVETHDRFRPGSDEAVRRALHSTFVELPRSGESLVFRRVQSA